MPTERALVLAWVARTRWEQGLPPMLMDAVVISRVASLLRASGGVRGLAPDGLKVQTRDMPDDGLVTSR
jgi:hypothetical protein